MPPRPPASNTRVESTAKTTMPPLCVETNARASSDKKRKDRTPPPVARQNAADSDSSSDVSDEEPVAVSSDTDAQLAPPSMEVKQKRYGQLSRRKKFCLACLHAATDGGTREIVSLAATSVGKSECLDENDLAYMAENNPASRMRFGHKFLLAAAAGGVRAHQLAARVTDPIVAFTKHRTVTARSYVTAKASQLAFEACRPLSAKSAGSLAEIIVEAAASEASTGGRVDPLLCFDESAWQSALAMGEEFGIDTAQIKAACMHLLAHEGKWSE